MSEQYSPLLFYLGEWWCSTPVGIKLKWKAHPWQRWLLRRWVFFAYFFCLLFFEHFYKCFIKSIHKCWLTPYSSHPVLHHGQKCQLSDLNLPFPFLNVWLTLCSLNLLTWLTETGLEFPFLTADQFPKLYQNNQSPLSKI